MALSQELKQMSNRVFQLENARGDDGGVGGGSGANSSEKENSNKNEVPIFNQPEMEPKSTATVKDDEPKKWLGAVAMEGRQCHPTRDLPDVPWTRGSFNKKQPPHIIAALVAAAPAKWDNAQCIQYECEWKNHTLCDTVAPTNYNGPEPPCCVHTLRDMAKSFDDAMCELGFEYFASYGMLLGLVRSDRLIPWTSDNDYIVTKQTISAIMSLAPEEKAVFDKHGISLFYDGLYYRVCITPTFMEGKLATSWRKKSHKWHPMVPYPYADVFIAHQEGGSMVDELGCAHPMEHFRPALHMGVYNHSFSVSVPRDQEAVLSSLYGNEWRTPDAKKSPHGDTKCRGNQMKLEEESKEEHNWRKGNSI